MSNMMIMQRRDSVEQDTQYVKPFQTKTDIHAVLASNGRIIYISANSKLYLGYLQGEMIGSFLKTFLHEEDQFLVESYFYNEHHLMPCTFRFIKKIIRLYGWRLQ